MNDELHTLSGAYAVHALPYAEWVQFEQHLHACAGCAAEVRRLRETAARLAEAVAEPPPARLRARLLDAAHRSRSFEDEPEQVRDDGPTIWRAPGTLPHVRLPPDAPTLGGMGLGHGDGDPPTLSLPPEQGEAVHRTAGRIPVTPDGTAGQPPGGGRVVPPRRRRTRLMAALTAASVAASVALGVVAFDARRDLGDMNTRDEVLTAVLAAPDAEAVRQPITTGGSGMLVISRTQGRMLFATSGLPELPTTQGYEVWLMGPEGPRSGGMLHRREDGKTPPMVLTPQDGDRHVALTVEPASGSKKPTTGPIMLAQLPGT